MAEMKKLYRDYFNINPKYYAAVTAQLIEEGKVDWKSFYPHETFIKLLDTTYKVLSGSAAGSIWVEGPYGTGKSHAALTIKSLLDASSQETEAYFREFGLSRDLCNKFLSLKSGGKILTIHRVGSAGIDTDADLIFAVQQSMMSALKANGIENQGEAAMTDAFLKWMETPRNRNYFSDLMAEERYAWIFGGNTVDDVIQRLKIGTGEQVERTMRGVMTVLKESGQYGIFIDVNNMADWIKSVIEKNHLAAVLFVWDEFSEYFLRHPVGLTGFQTLVEISQSSPFYFMIVTHESRNLFADAESAKKILDRFEKPVRIELPENIAFQLMNQAMKVTSDPLLRREWLEEDKPSLNEQLTQARQTIIREARNQATLGQKTVINDDELQGIVPLHPYAALILKHIATLFNSNQRSMFDFIISNDMTDAKGFKWYINSYGPQDDTQYLLTVDLLWDFFYAQNGLSDTVRGILDHYRRSHPDKLVREEQRVLKTVLLLQATNSGSYMSYQTSGGRNRDNNLLLPNDQNLELAFMGTEWTKGKAIAIAKGLIEKGLLFQRLISGGKFEYNATTGETTDSIEPYKKKVREDTKTQGLIVNGGLMETVRLPDAIRARFLLEGTGYASFAATINRLKASPVPERFQTVVTFAMDDAEMERTRQQIRKYTAAQDSDFLFIETLSPMGTDLLDQYVDAMAYSRYNMSSDKEQAKYYQNRAADVLREWQSKISGGAFMLYDASHPGGERKANLEDLQIALADKNHQKYYYGLEQYTLSTAMYLSTQPANGAECGILQETKQLFRSANPRTSVENALSGAWKVERYWEDSAKQGLAIVHIKKRVMEIVEEAFQRQAGEISMDAIWYELEKEPFGFMPSNLSALVLGFVMKEYVSPDYFWSDGSRSEPMSADKMKMMIANVIKQHINPAKNYRDEFIRTMSPELRAFLNCTAKAFRIPPENCGSVDSARDHIRIKMKEFDFPVWCVKYTLDQENLRTSPELVAEAIDNYTGVANTNNSRGRDTESGLAEEIGKAVLARPELADDLTRLLNGDQCRRGMRTYIGQYQGGELLKLAREIEDGGAYLEEVRRKFSAPEANWLWDASTADERISDVILEYRIIAESNKSLGQNTTLEDTVSAWNTRTNYIRMPCEVAMKHTGDLGPFLQQLLYMKQNGTLQEQHKRKFYEVLLIQRESFDHFYNNQLPCFVQDAKSFLLDLNEAEQAELYNGFPPGQFVKSRKEYYQMVETEVRAYLDRQLKNKLRNLWFEKTGTADPAEWSKKYRTPLLCMFDDTERALAREMFQIVRSAAPSKTEAEKALEYLQKADFYDRLADTPEGAAERDRCFTERVIGSRSILLDNPHQVRDYLASRSGESPYEWMDNRTVQNCLHELLDREYKLIGYERVKERIDRMDAESLRRYLLERIDDVDFGMQILKGE